MDVLNAAEPGKVCARCGARAPGGTRHCPSCLREFPLPPEPEKEADVPLPKPTPHRANLVFFCLLQGFALWFLLQASRIARGEGRGFPWIVLLFTLVFSALCIAGIVRALRGKELISPPPEGSHDE